MANTSADDWDGSSPALSEPRRDGALEITSLRGAVRTRLLKEHEEPAAAGVGGEHLPGSAKAYAYNATAPTLRPDAATAFTADDEGRLFRSDTNNRLKILNSSPAWVDIDHPGRSRNATYNTTPFNATLATSASVEAGIFQVLVQGSLTVESDFTLTINGVSFNGHALAGNFLYPCVVSLAATGTISITAITPVSGTGKLYAIMATRIAYQP